MKAVTLLALVVVSISLELAELQAIMSYHLGIGSWTHRILCVLGQSNTTDQIPSLGFKKFFFGGVLEL